MSDIIETIGLGSLVHHGKDNDRIYLMKLDKKDADTILNQLSKLAQTNSYSKIFCKIPKSIAPLFVADGYLQEAHIPLFYNQQEDVIFLSKFLTADRQLNRDESQLEILNEMLSKERKAKTLHSTYSVRLLNKTDVEKICTIYQEVFESYPFPIHNPDYIRETMDDNIQYYGAELNGELAALASSEIDKKGQNAEMTDFATPAAHQGNNLSSLLLAEMEKAMAKQGISTLYTIARLNSIPMNKTFFNFNYHFTGTLRNNTNIAGKIESMNVYYKHIL